MKMPAYQQDRDAAALGALLGRGVEMLRAAGIESARLDARLLLQAATGCRPETALLAPGTPVPTEAAARFLAYLRRRAGREPVSRIFGAREFWSLSFEIGPETLDPRPDSETLVAAALEASSPDRPGRVLDLGTGSGCLLLAVLSERPLMSGLGVDLSPVAARLAAANARRLGLTGRAAFIAGNWADSVRGKFDLILCNPPYIATGALADLPPEVRDFEPGAALDGGADGLAAYRALAGRVADLLAPGAAGFFELGEGQAQAVQQIFTDSGFTLAGLRSDLAGRPRCLAIRREPEFPDRK